MFEAFTSRWIHTDSLPPIPPWSVSNAERTSLKEDIMAEVFLVGFGDLL